MPRLAQPRIDRFEHRVEIGRHTVDVFIAEGLGDPLGKIACDAGLDHRVERRLESLHHLGPLCGGPGIEQPLGLSRFHGLPVGAEHLQRLGHLAQLMLALASRNVGIEIAIGQPPHHRCHARNCAREPAAHRKRAHGADQQRCNDLGDQDRHVIALLAVDPRAQRILLIGNLVGQTVVKRLHLRAQLIERACCGDLRRDIHRLLGGNHLFGGGQVLLGEHLDFTDRGQRLRVTGKVGKPVGVVGGHIFDHDHQCFGRLCRRREPEVEIEPPRGLEVANIIVDFLGLGGTFLVSVEKSTHRLHTELASQTDKYKASHENAKGAINPEFNAEFRKHSVFQSVIRALSPFALLDERLSLRGRIECQGQHSASQTRNPPVAPANAVPDHRRSCRDPRQKYLKFSTHCARARKTRDPHAPPEPTIQSRFSRHMILSPHRTRNRQR